MNEAALAAKVKATVLAAIEAFQRRDLVEAIAIIETSRLERVSPDLCYILGVCRLQSGEPERALRSLDRAVEMKPDFANAWSNRGLALKELCRLEEALACHDRAIALRPDYPEAWCNRGLVLQALGRRAEALASQERAVALKPTFPEAWSNRGTLLHDLGRYADAVAAYDVALRHQSTAITWYNRAIALSALGDREAALASYDEALLRRPAYPEALCNRGNLLKEFGRNEEALAAYERALTISPTYVEAWFNRGIALKAAGRLEEALAAYDTALGLRPAYPDALCNRGNLLKELGRLEEALASCDEAVKIQAAHTAGWSNRGLILHAMGDYAEAVVSHDKALALKADYPEAWTSRGVALLKLCRYEDALASFDRALAYRPSYAEAWSNRGVALQELERLEEALACFEKATEVCPSYAEAWSNRGIVQLLLGRTGESLACFDSALACRPNWPPIIFNRGVARLYAGDFERGLADYEMRWQRERPEKPMIQGAWPVWHGEDLRGRTIVVYAEQGLGDSLMFVRYVTLLRGLAGRVVFVCEPRMHRVLARPLEGVDVRASFEPHEQADFQIALLSLPYAMGTRVGTIPCARDYLAADPERVALWRGRLGPRGFRIGICWHGNRQGTNDRRAVPLAAFAPLAAIPGVRLIGLQKTHGLEQLDAMAPGMRVEMPVGDFDAGADAFVDTAALMMSLDLIVSSDTSVVHLAGGLGRPVWVALRRVPEWRWLEHGEATPWYPTMRLFRQERDGEWASVFERMAAELTRVPARGNQLELVA